MHIHLDLIICSTSLHTKWFDLCLRLLLQYLKITSVYSHLLIPVLLRCQMPFFKYIKICQKSYWTRVFISNTRLVKRCPLYRYSIAYYYRTIFTFNIMYSFSHFFTGVWLGSKLFLLSINRLLHYSFTLIWHNTQAPIL